MIDTTTIETTTQKKLTCPSCLGNNVFKIRIDGEEGSALLNVLAWMMDSCANAKLLEIEIMGEAYTYLYQCTDCYYTEIWNTRSKEMLLSYEFTGKPNQQIEEQSGPET